MHLRSQQTSRFTLVKTFLVVKKKIVPCRIAYTYYVKSAPKRMLLIHILFIRLSTQEKSLSLFLSETSLKATLVKGIKEEQLGCVEHYFETVHDSE